MATIVKGKICLCQTSLNDWSPEKVNGVLFYDRYQEFLRLFSAKIPEVNFEQCFAQPVYNDETKDVEWFIVPMAEYPSTLKEIPEPFAEAEKNRIIQAIKKASQTLSDNDLKYINPILVTLLSDKVDEITYHCNGKVVFAVWGMNIKKGKEIREVITEDIKDHRIHHVSYVVQGKGDLSFTDIVRRHGHELKGETDIPTFAPAEGYRVKEWLPESPSGVPVNGPLEFTIVFEKVAGAAAPDDIPEEAAGIAAEPVAEDIPQEAVTEEPKPEDPNYYDVKFTSDDRGVIKGQAEYRKKEGDRMQQSEVPFAEPREGYRFIGWTMNPIDYVVNGDTVFTAQYEPIEETVVHGPGGWFSGCLSWLLAALLLALIALLLWFLLGNHNISFCKGCDCDCDEEVVIEPDTVPNNIPDPVDPVVDPNTVKSVCDATEHAGTNEPESYVFDMGQESGDFVFQYATGDVLADRIIVFDGPNRNSKVLFNYKGTTGWCDYTAAKSVTLHFSHRYIFVDIIPDESDGTCWVIKPNCPN